MQQNYFYFYTNNIKCKISHNPGILNKKMLDAFRNNRRLHTQLHVSNKEMEIFLIILLAPSKTFIFIFLMSLSSEKTIEDYLLVIKAITFISQMTP